MSNSTNKSVSDSEQKDKESKFDKGNMDAGQDPKDSIQDSKYTEHTSNSSTKANFDVHTKNGKDDIIDKNTNQKPRDDI